MLTQPVLSPTNISPHKITISLPADLVRFADQLARSSQTSRSQIISMALAEVKARTEEQLAAEGYQFYAQESLDFAAASAPAVAQAIAEAIVSLTAQTEQTNKEGAYVR
jgi:predicted transcriptional regulator